MIYTAYLDESGTHGGSPVTVMGGVMASAQQWADFAKQFNRVKKRYGFEVFHTKKFKALRGDFTGWPKEKGTLFTLELATITEYAFTECATITMSNDDYKLNYRAGEKPKKLQLDSPYGLCFRACLSHFLSEVIKRKHKKKYPKLHIVLESGDPHVGGAINIFNEAKRELKDTEYDGILQTVTAADKDECDPLMMADFVAHTTYMQVPEVKAQELPKPPRSGPRGLIVYHRTPKPNRKPGTVAQLKFKPTGLSDLRRDILAEINRKKR